MSKQVQNFIDDARRFQRCSDHDLAISSLQLAQQEDHHKEHEIEIQKLFSLSYRKIGNYNMALLHINNAINQNAKRNNDKQAQNEHAICLMNKGIIYEESKRYSCFVVGVIGGADGPTAVIYGTNSQEKLHAACSALHFEPVGDDVEWRIVFNVTQFDKETFPII